MVVLYLLIEADVSMESGNRIRLLGRQRVPAIFLQGLSTKGLLQLRCGEAEETRHISVSLTPAVSFRLYYQMCLKTPFPVVLVLPDKNSVSAVPNLFILY